MDGDVKAIVVGIALILIANVLAVLGDPFRLPALVGALGGFGIVVTGVLRSQER